MPEPELSRIVDLVRLSDGTLVVADGPARRVRWFSPEGVPLFERGSDDEAELSSLSGLVRLPGDSVAAHDPNLRRVVTFGPDGGFGGIVPLAGFPVGLAPFMRVADGSYLIGKPSGILSLTSPGPAGVHRPTVEVLRLDPATRDTAVIATIPGAEMGVVENPASNTGFFNEPRVPFGRSTFVIGGDDRWVTADNERYEIQFRTLDGTIDMIARRPVEPRPVGAADRDLLLEEYASITVQRRLRAAWNSWTTRPETMPAFADVKLDSAGNVWVREFTLPTEDDSRWSVFGEDGVWLGTVEGPPGLEILAIGEDVVVGVRGDPEENQRIVVHPLDKP